MILDKLEDVNDTMIERRRFKPKCITFVDWMPSTASVTPLNNLVTTHSPTLRYRPL